MILDDALTRQKVSSLCLSITLIWFLIRVHTMMLGVHNYVNRLMEAEDHVE